jgi:NADH dehydrogenase [ubiquinone] 1 alpha subcomplex assembly factor 1
VDWHRCGVCDEGAEVGVLEGGHGMVVASAKWSVRSGRFWLQIPRKKVGCWMKNKLVAGYLALNIGFLMSANAEMEKISDFDGKEGDPKLEVKGDRVMGGRSEGEVVTEDGVLKFSGKLSLERNGGFIIFLMKGLELDFSGKEAFVLRVKGDGRKYKVRMELEPKNPACKQFHADLETKAGEFVEVKVPFSAFRPGWGGQIMEGDAPEDLSRILKVGLILADYEQGPFSVELDWIGVE